MHDAWAPYDTYTAPEHQLCCAHALRELQAVAGAAPAGGWCWAAQAAQVRLFRSAVLAGAGQTAARSGALMKKHHALARRLPGRQDDYLRFTRDFRAPAAA